MKGVGNIVQKSSPTYLTSHYPKWLPLHPWFSSPTLVPMRVKKSARLKNWRGLIPLNFKKKISKNQWNLLKIGWNLIGAVFVQWKIQNLIADRIDFGPNWTQQRSIGELTSYVLIWWRYTHQLRWLLGRFPFRATLLLSAQHRVTLHGKHWHRCPTSEPNHLHLPSTARVNHHD
jgi:hypothetical protein